MEYVVVWRVFACRFARRSLFVCLSSFAFACDSAPALVLEPHAPSLSEFCGSVVALVQHALSECAGGTSEDWALRDALTLSSSWEPVDCAFAQERVDAGRWSYNAHSASVCLRELTDTCPSLFAPPKSCLETFVGRGNIGDQCEFGDVGCGPGLACRPATPCGLKCAGLTLPSGAACDPATQRCESGLSCGRHSDEGTDMCFPLPMLGDACLSVAGNHLCDPWVCGRDGRCGERLQVDSKCALDDILLHDLSWPCAPGLQCAGHPASSVCSIPSRLGEPCDPTLEGDACLRSALRCSSAGRCIRLSVPGEECLSNGDCATRKCEHGLCVRLRILGDSCVADSKCTSGECRNGFCEAKECGR